MNENPRAELTYKLQAECIYNLFKNKSQEIKKSGVYHHQPNAYQTVWATHHKCVSNPHHRFSYSSRSLPDNSGGGSDGIPRGGVRLDLGPTGVL